MSGDYAGTGGLWLRKNAKAASKAPRWNGSFTCLHCGEENPIIGYGSDQQRSSSPNSPTIALRIDKLAQAKAKEEESNES